MSLYLEAHCCFKENSRVTESTAGANSNNVISFGLQDTIFSAQDLDKVIELSNSRKETKLDLLIKSRQGNYLYEKK